MEIVGDSRAGWIRFVDNFLSRINKNEGENFTIPWHYENTKFCFIYLGWCAVYLALRSPRQSCYLAVMTHTLVNTAHTNELIWNAQEVSSEFRYGARDVLLLCGIKSLRETWPMLIQALLLVPGSCYGGLKIVCHRLSRHGLILCIVDIISTVTMWSD